MNVVRDFVAFVPQHWEFCLLHFLEFSIWGAWFVVLGNFLNARGFSRKAIGRIYATIPIGFIISPLFIGAFADKYVNTELLLAGSHLIGAILLFALTRISRPISFFVVTLVYAMVFAPTLSLVNSIVFAHNDDLFGGAASEVFPWIRVFGTIGWIVAGLSHAVILKKDSPVNERPLLLACGLSLILGLFAFAALPETLPTTKQKNTNQEKAVGAVASVEDSALPEAVDDTEDGPSAETGKGLIGWTKTTGGLLAENPVFFGVSFVAAMAMGLYFAFTALYLEQSGVRSNLVGPVMTIGQMIEIFFMLTLPWFLGPEAEGFPHMKWVLLGGIGAWSLRFGLFSIGRPMALVLLGVAVHGICFDFFFAAGMINSNRVAGGADCHCSTTVRVSRLWAWHVPGIGAFRMAESVSYQGGACGKR